MVLVVAERDLHIAASYAHCASQERQFGGGARRPRARARRMLGDEGASDMVGLDRQANSRSSGWQVLSARQAAPVAHGRAACWSMSSEDARAIWCSLSPSRFSIISVGTSQAPQFGAAGPRARGEPRQSHKPRVRLCRSDLLRVSTWLSSADELGRGQRRSEEGMRSAVVWRPGVGALQVASARDKSRGPRARAVCGDEPPGGFH